MAVIKQGKQAIGVSPVDDYIYQPVELEAVCLYDWISHTKQVKKPKAKKPTAKKGTDTESEDDGESDDAKPDQHDIQALFKSVLFGFSPEHPLANSHCIQWSPNHSASIPNFIGQTLPRSDQGY